MNKEDLENRVELLENILATSLQFINLFVALHRLSSNQQFP